MVRGANHSMLKSRMSTHPVSATLMAPYPAPPPHSMLPPPNALTDSAVHCSVRRPPPGRCQAAAASGPGRSSSAVPARTSTSSMVQPDAPTRADHCGVRDDRRPAASERLAAGDRTPAGPASLNNQTRDRCSLWRRCLPPACGSLGLGEIEVTPEGVQAGSGQSVARLPGRRWDRQ